MVVQVINFGCLKSLSPVPVMICSMPVPICNRFYCRRATSGKIRIF